MEYQNIRQMMAEMKYFEVQKVLEFELTHHPTSPRKDLIPILLECLKEQGKALPSELVLEASENGELSWLQHFPLVDEKKFFLRFTRLKMKLAEERGEVEELHSLISKCQIFLFNIKAPSFPQELFRLIDKYFKNDFQLKLQNLALNLLLRNNEVGEKQTQDLILSCFERSTPKGKHDKLEAIMQVIVSYEDLFFTQLYYHLCLFLNRPPQEKNEFKKLTELVIYCDDFKSKILVLHILSRDGIDESCKIMANEIRKLKDYDFVYLDKYFPHLKKYFATAPVVNISENLNKPLTADDLKLSEKVSRYEMMATMESDPVDEEALIIQSLKYQDHSSEQLIDISVSFLQSEMPRVALRAAEISIERDKSERMFLKASYLMITALLLLKDFRGALDWSHRGLEKAEGRDEILAFLYSQSEAYLRLGLLGDAKFVMKKILTIDQDYRLVKERLAKLE